MLLVASVGVSDWNWFGAAFIIGDDTEPMGNDVVATASNCVGVRFGAPVSGRL